MQDVCKNTYCTDSDKPEHTTLDNHTEIQSLNHSITRYILSLSKLNTKKNRNEHEKHKIGLNRIRFNIPSNTL